MNKLPQIGIFVRHDYYPHSIGKVIKLNTRTNSRTLVEIKWVLLHGVMTEAGISECDRKYLTKVEDAEVAALILGAQS